MPENGKDKDSGLRIAHAGFIQFFSQLISLVTGFAFVTLVTRNLTVSDFGLWQLVGTSTGIAILPMSVIYFWNLRAVARGEDVGKTSLVAGMFTLPLSFVIFLAISGAIDTRVEIFTLIIVAGMLQLPFLTLFEFLKSMVQGSRPALLGYSSIPFELAKVGLAYYLVVVLKVGIAGAILALAFAYAVQDVSLLYGIRGRMSGKVDLRKMAEWIKASWVLVLTNGVSRLWTSDAIIVALVLGTTEPIGLFQGARVFTAIILFSEIFLRVLYPKLVRDRLGSDIGVAFRLQTLLEIPMIFGTLVLAEEMLSVLGAEYLSSAPILRLLAAIMMVESTERVMNSVLYGAEIADSKPGGLSFSSIKSSWLFKLPLLDLTRSLIYVIALSSSLLLLASPSSPESAAIIWAVVYSLIVAPYAVLKVFLARRLLPHTLPWREVIKYTFAGIVMGIFLLAGKSSPVGQEISAVESVLGLAFSVGLGALVYFSLVFLIDAYFRNALLRFLGGIRK